MARWLVIPLSVSKCLCDLRPHKHQEKGAGLQLVQYKCFNVWVLWWNGEVCQNCQSIWAECFGPLKRFSILIGNVPELKKKPTCLEMNTPVWWKRDFPASRLCDSQEAVHGWNWSHLHLLPFVLCPISMSFSLESYPLQICTLDQLSSIPFIGITQDCFSNSQLNKNLF